MSSPDAGKTRILASLKTRLEKAKEEEKTATDELGKAKESDKAAAISKKEAATKIVKDIEKQIEGLEGKNAPERVNNFGKNVGTLFENAKEMEGTYPDPKTDRKTYENNFDDEPTKQMPDFIEKFLKKKYPCERDQSREGIKIAEEILGNSGAVNDLNPDLVCKLAEEPDICETDRGVILDSRCAAHQVVLSQSLSSLDLSVRNDIKKANAEYKAKLGLPIGPVMPTALGKRARPEQTPTPTPTPKPKPKKPTKTPTPTPTQSQSIVKYDNEPDNWNGTGDPNLLTFNFDSSKNKLYSEYSDENKFYRIYGDNPEQIIDLFLKHFAASHGMPYHLVFQLDMESGLLYAADPNDKSNLIYGKSPEEIVVKFQKSLESGNEDEDENTPTPPTAPKPLTPPKPPPPVPLTKDEVYEQVFNSYSRFLCDFLKAEQKIPIDDTNMKKFFDIFVNDLTKYEKFDDVNKNIISDLLNNGIPEIQKIIKYYADESVFGNISDSDKNNIKILKNVMLQILSKNYTIDKNIIADKIRNICPK
jgi:hypothetical protein